MLASGLWHGASWNMLFWGGLHGTFLVIEQLSQKWRPSKIPGWQGVIGRVITLIFVFFAWIPFQFELSSAAEYIRGLFVWESLTLPDFRILVVIAFSIVIDWLQEKANDEVVFLRWPLAYRAGVLGLALLAIFFVSQADLSFTFIYQGF
jgi:alginate O-acetyltransferase complex protein AlgI